MGPLSITKQPILQPVASRNVEEFMTFNNTPGIDWTQLHGGSARPQMGYGYQWSTLKIKGRPAFAAVRRAGQPIEVIDELDAVIVASEDDADYSIDALDLLNHVNLDLIPELE